MEFLDDSSDFEIHFRFTSSTALRTFTRMLELRYSSTATTASRDSTRASYQRMHWFAQSLRLATGSCSMARGGDELFHGYRFRGDFGPVDGWPRAWPNRPMNYSRFTTLIDYIGKVDRAAGYFGLECRQPLLSIGLERASDSCEVREEMKWPLRRFLREMLGQGAPSPVDWNAKYGFSLRNVDRESVIGDLQRAWEEERGAVPERVPGETFPFRLGEDCILAMAG